MDWTLDLDQDLDLDLGPDLELDNFSSRQTLHTPVAGLKSAALVTTDQSMLYWTFWSFRLQT